MKRRDESGKGGGKNRKKYVVTSFLSLSHLVLYSLFFVFFLCFLSRSLSHWLSLLLSKQAHSSCMTLRAGSAWPSTTMMRCEWGEMLRFFEMKRKHPLSLFHLLSTPHAMTYLSQMDPGGSMRPIKKLAGRLTASKVDTHETLLPHPRPWQPICKDKQRTIVKYKK